MITKCRLETLENWKIRSGFDDWTCREYQLATCHHQLREELETQYIYLGSRLLGSIKVISVQEACAKCFAVHISKFEILQITWKNWSKEHQTLSFQFFTNRSIILMVFVLLFHVVCKISNFNMWTATNLAQASCTELTLHSSREAKTLLS